MTKHYLLHIISSQRGKEGGAYVNPPSLATGKVLIAPAKYIEPICVPVKTYSIIVLSWDGLPLWILNLPPYT